MGKTMCVAVADRFYQPRLECLARLVVAGLPDPALRRPRSPRRLPPAWQVSPGDRVDRGLKTRFGLHADEASTTSPSLKIISVGMLLTP